MAYRFNISNTQELISYRYNECGHTDQCQLGDKGSHPDAYSGSTPLLDSNNRIVIGGDGKPVLMPLGTDMATFAKAGRDAVAAMMESAEGMGMLGGGSSLFLRGNSWDLQRLDGHFSYRYIDAATVAIGVYFASANLTIENCLEIQNFVA